MPHKLVSLPGAWILSFSFTLAGRYALVTLHLHKQACYYNMMECCVFSPAPLLWDTVICRKSKLVIRRLIFIVRLPCLETFDKQCVATAEKRCWRILWELAKIIPHSVQLPCENASPHWLIFHRQNERFAVWARWWITPKHIPYGKSGWCRREKGERAPATNCLHCQLVHVPFFALLLLLEGERVRRGVFYFVRWRLFCLLRDIWKSLQVVESLWIGGRLIGNFQSALGEQNRQRSQHKNSLRWWFAPSALSIPVSSGEQASRQWAGGQTSCPVRWLDGCQFESLGCV